MYKTMSAAVIGIGITVLALQANPDLSMDRAIIEKAVLEANAAMAEAEKALDPERFFSHVLDFDEGLLIQDGTVFRTRREALDTVEAGFQGISAVDRIYNRTYVTVVSAEAALLTAQGTSSVTLSDGRTLTSPFAVSSLFVLRDGRWKLLHGHYSTPNPR